MKNTFNIILILGFSFASFVLSAQTVVLINGVPTKVVMEGTEIIEVQGEAAGYLSGFETTVTQGDSFQYAELRLNQASTPATAAAPLVQAPKEKVISKSVSANSPIVSGNYFNFPVASAILSSQAIKDIKQYSSQVKSGKASSILLESFHLANDKKSIDLTRNRLDACKRYFEINGVSSSVIVTNLYPNDSQSDKVSVTIR